MSLRTVILGAAVVCATYLTFNATSVSEQYNDSLSDLAELDHIRHGMFDPAQWIAKVGDALAIKLEALRRQPMPTNELRAGVERLIRQHVRMERTQLLKAHGNNTLGGIELPKRLFGREIPSIASTKRAGINAAFDLVDRAVPELSESVTESILQDDGVLHTVISKTLRGLDIRSRDSSIAEQISTVLERNQCSPKDLEACRRRMRSSIREQTPGLAQAVAACCLIFICLVASLRSRKAVGTSEVYLLTIGVGALLLGGVLNPMMVIQARLDNFSLDLLGTTIGFENQIIFFQSKSIIDVLVVLVSSGSHASMIVGLLIGLFSVIFPLTKLLGSVVLRSYPFQESVSKPITSLLGGLGKWSMADVFVVAIFMSFIGFDGIIDSQLNQLEAHNSNTLQLSAHRGASHFGVGLYLFLGFCICSQMLTSLLKKDPGKFDSSISTADIAPPPGSKS